MLERHPVFPEGANISIASVETPDAISLRTWERGAGLTKACGSAACAACACAVRLGVAERRVNVSMPGGILDIEWTGQNGVSMTGTVEYEFHGTIEPKTGRWSRDMEDNAG